MVNVFRSSLLIFSIIAVSSLAQADQLPDAPSSFPDQPECKVQSVKKSPTAFENVVTSPVSGDVAVTQLDAHGVYQVYTGKVSSSNLTCISCALISGAPRLDRNKPMISWHPSGKWLVVGVEETTHDLMWTAPAFQRGILQSGIWLNIWVTTPSGDHWYQITDFKKTGSGPSDGFVGTSFSPDGKKAVWAEIVDGNIFANHFGVWKLYVADFVVAADGTPAFVNKRDITPTGARWVEPGNFSADGKLLLLSSDIGMTDAQGQDQFALELSTGKVKNLTNSSSVWDEHGLFSPDSNKISFMSSYPYRRNSYSNQTIFLTTEFMMMDADGSHLQQITHFNVPGYPESQASGTVAAVAGFGADGSQLFATVMGPNFTKSNWVITFDGSCGRKGQIR